LIGINPNAADLIDYATHLVIRGACRITGSGGSRSLSRKPVRPQRNTAFRLYFERFRSPYGNPVHCGRMTQAALSTRITHCHRGRPGRPQIVPILSVPARYRLPTCGKRLTRRVQRQYIERKKE